LKNAPEAARADREVVLAAAAKDGLVLGVASEELQGDREVVLRAVAQNGMALESASAELRADDEVVRLAVSKDGLALQFASPELLANSEVVRSAVAKDGLALQYASQLHRADRAMVLRAIATNGKALKYAAKELRADRAVALTAFEQEWHSLAYAGPELWFDREYVTRVVAHKGKALQWASPELRADPELVLTAVKQTGEALQFASSVIVRCSKIEWCSLQCLSSAVAVYFWGLPFCGSIVLFLGLNRYVFHKLITAAVRFLLHTYTFLFHEVDNSERGSEWRCDLISLLAEIMCYPITLVFFLEVVKCSARRCGTTLMPTLSYLPWYVVALLSEVSDCRKHLHARCAWMAFRRRWFPTKIDPDSRQQDEQSKVVE